MSRYVFLTCFLAAFSFWIGYAHATTFAREYKSMQIKDAEFLKSIGIAASTTKIDDYCTSSEDVEKCKSAVKVSFVVSEKYDHMAVLAELLLGEPNKEWFLAVEEPFVNGGRYTYVLFGGYSLIVALRIQFGKGEYGYTDFNDYKVTFSNPIETESNTIPQTPNQPLSISGEADLSDRRNRGSGRAYEPGETFRDHLRGGGEGPEMVVVPAGSFRMGCVSGQDCRDNELPVHRVMINQAFALGKYEVTFAEYNAFVTARGWGQPDDKGWGRGDRPAIYVSWNDARTYVQWLSRETGERYRLPSEAEWEYAARAGMETRFYTGECIDTSQANYNGNYALEGCERTGLYRRRTVPVGSFPANSFSLHDMHGNVWEWVGDCWNDSYDGAPTDGSTWTVRECENRISRGGSWSDAPRIIRLAERLGHNVYYLSSTVGFRVARTLTP